MPNIVTHGLMALDVYNQIDASRVKSAIKDYPKSYLLGSNGPDILFYYQAMPWQNKEANKAVADCGHAVHSSNINEFYNESLKFIFSIKDKRRQDILIAYIAGHLQHWVLDSLAHPFIFYRSGPLTGPRPNDHYRYESMIDSLMILYVKRKTLQQLKVKRFVDVNEEERRVIASFYQNMLSSVFDRNLDAKVIEDAIITFKKSLTYLYDPNNIYYPMLKALDKKAKVSGKYSSHVVHSRIDAKDDVLNLKHESWSNPTNIEETSTQSFVDIYNQAIDVGIDSIEYLNEYLEGKHDNFDLLLQGRCYDTGRAEGVKMEYFDSIYLKRF